jgi:hypothetical protein
MTNNIDCNISYKLVNDKKSEVVLSIEKDNILVDTSKMRLSETLIEKRIVTVLYKGKQVSEFNVSIRVELPKSPCELSLSHIWHMTAQVGSQATQKFRV